MSNSFGGSGSVLPALIPKRVLPNPVLVCKTSWQKSLCLPSALLDLLQILKPSNPPSKSKQGSYYTLDSKKDGGPPGQQGSGAAGGFQLSMPADAGGEKAT